MRLASIWYANATPSAEGVVICPIRETEGDLPYTARLAYRQFAISPTLAKSLHFTAVPAHRSRSASTALKNRLVAALCSERTRVVVAARKPVVQQTDCCEFDHYRSGAAGGRIRGELSAAVLGSGSRIRHSNSLDLGIPWPLAHIEPAFCGRPSGFEILEIFEPSRADHASTATVALNRRNS